MQLANSITAGPNPIPIILTWVFTPVAIIVVCLRFYCRHMKGANLMMDDWIILPALLFAVAQALIFFANAFVGDLGKHQPLDPMGKAIPSPRLELFQQLEYASFLTFVPALLFAKLSILHLYNRIFQVQTYFRVMIWTTYGINIAWGVVFFVGYVFKCWPISDYWETANLSGKCLPYTYNFAFAFSNVVLDVVILVMPLPMVWSLNITWRQKLAVSSIFLLGTIVVALSVAKAVAFFQVMQEVQINNDIMWDEAPLFYFSVPEALVAVTSACLPTLRPLFRKLSAPLTSQMSRTGKSASAAAISALNHVDLSSRGIPVRERGRASCASPAGPGLGRERGLSVDRRSMAGGVMWEYYIRRSDDLTEQGYAPWQRDGERVPDEEKWFTDSSGYGSGSAEDLERGLAPLRSDASRASHRRSPSAERSPVSLNRSVMHPMQPRDMTMDEPPRSASAQSAREMLDSYIEHPANVYYPIQPTLHHR